MLREHSKNRGSPWFHRTKSQKGCVGTCSTARASRAKQPNRSLMGFTAGFHQSSRGWIATVLISVPSSTAIYYSISPAISFIRKRTLRFILRAYLLFFACCTLIANIYIYIYRFLCFLCCIALYQVTFQFVAAPGLLPSLLQLGVWTYRPRGKTLAIYRAREKVWALLSYGLGEFEFCQWLDIAARRRAQNAGYWCTRVLRDTLA
jgi:hypothetical protein